MQLTVHCLPILSKIFTAAADDLVEGKTLKTVHVFAQLGSTVTNDDKVDKANKTLRGKASIVSFGKLQEA